jgi:peptidoglycan/LPS O-acetylase OafA/YrhL
LIGLDIYHFVGVDANRHLYFTMQQVQTQELITVGPAWSLAPEIYFYLLAPWLVKFKKRSLAILIFLSLFFRIAVYQKLVTPVPIESIYRFFPFEIALFLIGGLAYKFSTQIKISSKAGLLTFFIMPLSILVAVLFHLNYKTCWILYSIIFLCLVFSNFKLPNHLFKIDNLLGQFSFPIYIIHYVVLNIALAVFHQHNLILCTALVFAACLPLWLLQNYLNKKRNIFWLKIFNKKP